MYAFTYHYEEHFYQIIMNLDKRFRCIYVVKKVSYLECWQLLCLADLNHLCNFGRGHYGEYACELILNLIKWSRRGRLKK